MAVRGTDSSLDDKLTDATVEQVTFHDPNTRAPPPLTRSSTLRRLRFLIPCRPTSDEPRVHRGFYCAARSVLPQVKALLQLGVGAEAGWTVTVTGHSLGAAVAMLIAYELKLDSNWCVAA